MAMTRRAFAVVSALAALGALTGRGLGKVDAAAAAAAPALRPPSAGSSSVLCSRCGSPAHMALDGACDEDARTRRAVQASARDLVGAARSGEGRGRA